MILKKDNYFVKVYDITRKIPFGRVTTYGIIASYLGLGSARMVGWALNKSFSAGLEVPAHRVVNRNGELTGRNHFPSPYMMQQLLESEGIKVENNKVKDFEKILWFPPEY